jgi:predicted glycosyltransferase
VKIWVDLSNSPHPLLFAPVAQRLEALGHQVLVTARDNAQTVELARERWPDVEVIGADSPPGRFAKTGVMAARIRDLARWGRRHGAQVALSHNSYGQIVAARAIGIPAVTAMDYEGQPANHLGFRLARTVLLPAALRGGPVEKQGATAAKTRYYDGLKEEVYLADTVHDPDVLSKLGVERPSGGIVVVARTPPSRAAYHRFGNVLFTDALEAVSDRGDAAVVVLTRHPEQREEIAALGLRNCTVPTAAVDSRSLIRAADLMLGAGGTMTREAALLGVPTFSLFAGAQPAVDRWLEQQGLLRRLESLDDVRAIEPRTAQAEVDDRLRRRGEELVGFFAAATVDAASS